jgi:hypothetical protein
MNPLSGFVLGRSVGSWLSFVPRVVLVMLLLATAATAAVPAANAGGARISSSYALSGGTITVQGSNFRANANILVTIVDTSQGKGYETTRELTTRTNKRGAFSVSSPGWCPRTVEITAEVVGRGTTVHDTLETFDCPW